MSALDDRCDHDGAHADRINSLSQAIEDREAEIADFVDCLIDDLAEAGAFRIHRCWSAFKERKELARAAAKAAVRVVLTNPWTTLPAEVQWLHVDRTEAQP